MNVLQNELYLILPNIRSCHNVGAMFRTADACGVTKIFLVGYTARPPKKEIDKVSLGAETWVPWEYVETIEPLIVDLKQQGVSLIALERAETSVPIATANVHGPLALIVGNEVDGVLPSILEQCDAVVHIPMYGRKESLNVSIAAGIALYTLHEALRAQ